MRRYLIGALALSCLAAPGTAAEILCPPKHVLTQAERTFVSDVEHIWPRALLQTLNAADPQRWRKLTGYGAPPSACTPIK